MPILLPLFFPLKSVIPDSYRGNNTPAFKEPR